MLRILVADDHPLIRKGLVQVFTEYRRIGQVDEAANGDEVLELIRRHHYDILLLDISMPGKEGLDVLKDVKAIEPELPVLILSIHPEEQYAIRAFKAGAAGCLNKSSNPQELIRAIHQVVEGHTYISPQAGDLLLNDLKGGQAELPHRKLSDREYQVMILLASGLTLKDISEKLCLSEKTVSTYRSRLLEKMGLKKNAQLTHYVFKHRLLG